MDRKILDARGLGEGLRRWRGRWRGSRKGQIRDSRKAVEVKARG